MQIEMTRAYGQFYRSQEETGFSICDDFIAWMLPKGPERILVEIQNRIFLQCYRVRIKKLKNRHGDFHWELYDPNYKYAASGDELTDPQELMLFWPSHPILNKFNISIPPYNILEDGTRELFIKATPTS